MSDTPESVAAYVVERDGLRLVIDPVALEALRAAQAAGITSPASFGSLPDIEELPLRVVGIEARLEALEREVRLVRPRGYAQGI